MKYFRAAWAIFLAWSARKAHLSRGFVEDLEDEASMRMFICSLDFEVAETVVPIGWRCEHFNITAPAGVLGQVTSGCGCSLVPVYHPDEIAA